MAVKPVPDGYHAVTPYLVVDGAAKAIDLYKKVFGATEKFRMGGPGDKVMHAELKVGDSVVMIADEQPQMGFRGPLALGGTPVSIMLYVNNVDEVADKLTGAGGKTLRPAQNQFWGDRMGTYTDPFGHIWSIATHVEDVPPQEMQKRAEAAMQQHTH
jgi:PhnB protein